MPREPRPPAPTAPECPKCAYPLLYKVDGKVYSKLVGLEIQGEYDGISYWSCPNCKVVWDRFTGEEKEWSLPNA